LTSDSSNTFADPSSEGARAEIRAHIERHIGPVGKVFREQDSLLTVDILSVPAAIDRPVHMLFTVGMSDRAMNTGGRKNAPRHIELMMTLPETWKLDSLGAADPGYWPIRVLAQLAREPLRRGTALGWGDTVANGEPPIPYAKGTALCGVIIAPSLLVPKDFYQLDVDRRHIEFYAAIPLYREELKLRADEGMETLLTRLLEHRVNDLVDPRRRNVTKKLFGLF
jgi:hypothetical protein